MKVGFKFHDGTKQVTLWTTPGKQGLQRDAPITSVRLSFADTEISECQIQFENPSERFMRAMLAKVIAEPTPLDQEVSLLKCSLWVQHPRFGYEPVLLFVGLALDMGGKMGAPNTMSLTLHDFSRLQNIERDLQDYQNLTDGEIAISLMQRFSEAVPGVIREVVVDQQALMEYRTNASYGAVRRWNASLVDPKGYLSAMDKLRAYASVLGMRLSVKHIVEDGTEKTVLSIAPRGQANSTGIEPAADKAYVRGDGEVMDFSWQYSAPGAVMTRNVNDRRFDPYLEAWRLERAKCGTKIDKDGLIKTNDGRVLSSFEIVSQRSITDSNGKPLTTTEVAQISEPMFRDNVIKLGWNSQQPLREYQKQIAGRTSIFNPSGTAGPNASTTQSSNGVDPTASFTVMENQLGQGTLYWRFTGKLTVLMNPFITTTDYLQLQGFGLFDGVWGIRSITHDISNSMPKTMFDLTFGDPVRLSQ